MRIISPSSAAGWLIAGVFLFLLPDAHSQQKTAGMPGDYPVKPIRFVIASSAGGALDISGRVVAAKLSERWGSVIAENRAGNGVAFDVVLKAASDGHTLLVGSISAFVGAELVLKAPYDVRTKFPPIAQFIATPYIVSVNNELPVKNLREFVIYARANPNKLNYAYGAIGSAPQLFGELLKASQGIDMQGIPFKGVGPSYLEQMAGRINLTVGTAASAGPLVKSGKIRGIAVTSSKRTRAIPDLATAVESLSGFDTMEAWVGLLGGEGISPSIISVLNKEVNAVLRIAEVEKLLTADGSETTQHTPEQFRKVIADSLDSTARIIKQAGIRME